MTRTFYLSFADDERFRGGCYVEVTEFEATVARAIIREEFPYARPGAEWIVAAASVARRLGCNPGGEMACVEIPGDIIPKHVERGRLYSKAELENQA